MTTEQVIAPPRAVHPTPALLEVHELAKSFGPTRAIRRATFELREGEVHALVGENGSGKSTLVKLLSGVHAPDSGAIHLHGTAASLSSPRDALVHGVATVFQEVLIAENLSVLDNLWLGSDALFRAGVPDKVRRSRAAEILEELLDTPPSLDTPVGQLELSDRQACAIARALLRDPKILVLDEATSALDFDTRTRLFRAVVRLSQEGMGVVLITHRMDEIEEIGDRITVMRSGETVGTLDRGQWNEQEIIRLMTGAEHLVQSAARGARAGHAADAPVVLAVERVRLARGRAPIDVAFRRGEIVGLAGLEGHGQDAFLKCLHGRTAGEGEVLRLQDAARRPVTSPVAAQRLGIAYVARDRRRESLFPWMSILENFSLPTLGRDSRLGMVSAARSEARLTHFVDRLKIKLGRPQDAITTLSGGNQQKVILARWLASEPQILLLNDPTRGIDVNAKRDLYHLLEELAEQGMTVVMLSTEVDEHVELMDRVLVFRENELSAEMNGPDLSAESLVAAFFGGETEVNDVD